MKATRRAAAVAASGVAALGLAGCTSEGSASSSTPAGTTASSATETTPADPDQVALDRAVALTVGLLAGLAAANPGVDPAGRLAAIHRDHLAALQTADATASTAPSPNPPSRPWRADVLRRRELNAQRELARLALAADSGALARVFASMSAGIAAALSHRGEVPR